MKNERVRRGLLRGQKTENSSNTQKRARILRVFGSPRPSKIQDFIAGTVVGALSSAIGVGGATYTMNYFAIRHNIELKDSTTVSNYMGLAVGAAGVLGFLLPSLMHHKTIDLGMPLVYVELILLTGWFGAQWGVVLQKYANVSSIKRLIYAMLIGTIGYPDYRVD